MSFEVFKIALEQGVVPKTNAILGEVEIAGQIISLDTYKYWASLLSIKNKR